MEEILFYLAQVFGAGGTITTIVSFQRKQKKKLLRTLMFSSILYIAQYICLGAWAGCAVKSITLVRNYVFSKLEKVPAYLVILFIAAIWIASILTYNGPVSLLPCLGTSILTAGLALRNLTLVRMMDIVACVVYITYNITVGAYTGAFAVSLELISSVIAIIRFRRLGTSKKSANKKRSKASTSKKKH